MARGGGTPQVNATTSGKPTEQRDRPVKRMVSCLPKHRADSVDPRLPHPKSQGVECAGKGVVKTGPPGGGNQNLNLVVGGMTRREARDGVEGEVLWSQGRSQERGQGQGKKRMSGNGAGQGKERGLEEG